jgi:hypothetical protein
MSSGAAPVPVPELLDHPHPPTLGEIGGNKFYAWRANSRGSP